MNHEKIFAMQFSKVYSLPIHKAEKKGRTKAEVYEVTTWLTGYTADDLDGFLEQSIAYGEFFERALQPNENRCLIKGSVCGVRVETIEDPLLREIRYLDKLVDELAKGKTMDKILRK